MKILAVADAVDSALYDRFDPTPWRDVDLVVSCGDLPAGYLEFLATALAVPVYYVRGNHDLAYADNPPGGCENVDGRVMRFGGLVLAGVEGSASYSGSELQYTEAQMARKLWALRLRLWLPSRVDVVISHSAPRFCPRPQCDPAPGPGHPCPLDASLQCTEPADRAHQGFRSLRSLILAHRPRYFLHGHTHLGYGAGPRRHRLGQTEIVDCYRSAIIEVQV